MRPPRLGVLTSHPIQYQAPLFRALGRRADLKVFFAHRTTPEQQAAAGFGIEFDWDIELTSGYDGVFLANRARTPGADRFWGTDTPDIAGVIARERFDALVVMGWHLRCYWQAVLACRRLRVPVLIRGDSQLVTSRSLLKKLAKEATHRWIVRQFDGFLYTGRRNHEYLLHYGASGRRSFFSPHVVDNEWFRDRSSADDTRLPELRARLGIGAEERVVLFAGKLIPKKRPPDAARALGLLTQQGLPVRLVVAGSGPLQGTVSRTAAELGVRIDFVGFQNQTQMPQWYALADVLVLPSDGGETWGLVVNEAMACGTPAVVSDAVGCGPDLIDPGRTGSVFPLGDVTALADAVATMSGRKHDPQVQAALAAKMERYAIPTAVDGILEAAARMADRRRQGAGWSRALGHAPSTGAVPTAARSRRDGTRNERCQRRMPDQAGDASAARRADSAMKVAHVIAGLDNPAAGTSYSVLSLAGALAGQGVAGQVHTLQPVPEGLSARCRIVAYPRVPVLMRLGLSPAMRRGLATADGDLLHNHGVWMMPNIYAAAVARERRVPLLLSPRGMLSAWAMAFSRRRKQLSWWCLGQGRAVAATACFHATSEAEVRDIRRLGLRQPIAVVPNGVDLPDLDAQPPSVGGGQRHRVLFLGRIHPKKGIPILLRAWQGVAPHHPSWELIIAGPDEAGHQSEVRALAGELGLTRISFAGPAYNEAKAALYRGADLFVLPTHSENFGMVVAEALSYGLPVITTTGAPWRELRCRDCGWWIELSEANLAQALRTAMSLPENRRRQMGRLGRLWMHECFGWPRLAGEMKAVYEWVLGGGPPPSCVVTD